MEINHDKLNQLNAEYDDSSFIIDDDFPGFVKFIKWVFLVGLAAQIIGG